MTTHLNTDSIVEREMTGTYIIGDDISIYNNISVFISNDKNNLTI